MDVTNFEMDTIEKDNSLIYFSVCGSQLVYLFFLEGHPSPELVFFDMFLSTIHFLKMASHRW